MITLDIRSYCADCTEFDPVLDKRSASYLNEDGMPEKCVDTVVRCKGRNKCEGISRYLKKEMLKDGNA